MKTIKNILPVIWQLPQTAVALIILCYCKAMGKVHAKTCFAGCDVNAVIYALEYEGYRGFSPGYIVFMTHRISVQEAYVTHECGHSLQSRHPGWLYLTVIAIPSLTVTALSPAPAQRCYFERRAEKLAVKIRHGRPGI
jgi:hypothetical protein